MLSSPPQKAHAHEARAHAAVIGVKYAATITCLLLASLLGGCASMEELGVYNQANKPSCDVDADGALVVRGPTDENFLQCIDRRPSQRTGVPLVIRISSAGGDVEPAIAAAEGLAAQRPHLVIEGMCASSCANYLIPVAGKVTLAPGARIVLHGSIDGFFKMKYSHLASADKLYDMQAAFVARHRVPLGWLLYRDGTADEGFGRHVTGVPEPLVTGQGEPRFFLVDEAFFRSCLPQVEVSGFETGAATMIAEDAALRKALSRQGMHRTAQMRCAAAE
jgi:hypothetical protein